MCLWPIPRGSEVYLRGRAHHPECIVIILQLKLFMRLVRAVPAMLETVVRAAAVH